MQKARVIPIQGMTLRKLPIRELCLLPYALILTERGQSDRQVSRDELDYVHQRTENWSLYQYILQ